MTTLVDVYSAPEAARVLFELLQEREPQVSISHKQMPLFDEHCAFVASRPYTAWYLIGEGGAAERAPPATVGAIYLSKANEVGLFVFKAHQGKGHGRRALELLAGLHPDARLIANIAPSNGASQRFFERAGFRHIQNTYERA